MGSIRLPRSGNDSNGLPHIRILSAVAEYRESRPFEGKIVRPGARVDVDSLPTPAVLIECAGHPRGAPRGEIQWILWQLDREKEEWRELCRAQSAGLDWLIAIKPLALCALRGARRIEPEIPLIAERILKSVDAELLDLPSTQRFALLCAIDPGIVGRMAEWEPLTI